MALVPRVMGSRVTGVWLIVAYAWGLFCVGAFLFYAIYSVYVQFASRDSPPVKISYTAEPFSAPYITICPPMGNKPSFVPSYYSMAKRATCEVTLTDGTSRNCSLTPFVIKGRAGKGMKGRQPLLSKLGPQPKSSPSSSPSGSSNSSSSGGGGGGGGGATTKSPTARPTAGSGGAATKSPTKRPAARPGGAGRRLQKGRDFAADGAKPSLEDTTCVFIDGLEDANGKVAFGVDDAGGSTFGWEMITVRFTIQIYVSAPQYAQEMEMHLANDLKDKEAIDASQVFYVPLGKATSVSVQRHKFVNLDLEETIDYTGSTSASEIYNERAKPDDVVYEVDLRVEPSKLGTHQVEAVDPVSVEVLFGAIAGTAGYVFVLVNLLFPKVDDGEEEFHVPLVHYAEQARIAREKKAALFATPNPAFSDKD